jgi:hypothetical protein
MSRPGFCRFAAFFRSLLILQGAYYSRGRLHGPLTGSKASNKNLRQSAKSADKLSAISVCGQSKRP